MICMLVKRPLDNNFSHIVRYALSFTIKKTFYTRNLHHKD